MPSVDDLLAAMRANPSDVRFKDLLKVCEHYFGSPRRRGSHVNFKVPWSGDPMVRVQEHNGRAKAYQVRQVLRAIERLADSDAF